MTDNQQRLAGPSDLAPAQVLIDAGFATEIADAPYLHHGLNLADMAHVLDLEARGLVPQDAIRDLARVLLEAHETPPEDFPYDPAFGETYNCREKHFSEAIGDASGWLHAGRPRREAARVAMRLVLRRMCAELGVAGARFVESIASVATDHAESYMADQTYLQHAQPSTFGHYLLGFGAPALRDVRRLLSELRSVNLSPGGAGCVNGTRLLDDRRLLAGSLGFLGIIEHTRDAMWQTDVLVSLLSITTSLVSNASKLAEDLEIWSSPEFDYVELAGPYTRSSVLMPQKRNPYALSIVRGASGVLIGRLSGFLSVIKTPSARGDNYIYAYGEVPRAMDLARRSIDLMTGVISTVSVNRERLQEQLDRGFSQSTDLAEYVMLEAGIDYRTAYRVVGNTVRRVSREGRRGLDITGGDIDEAAVELLNAPIGMRDVDLTEVLDPRKIVQTRRAQGGASPGVVVGMAAELAESARAARVEAESTLAEYDHAENQVLQRTKEAAGVA
ncbi:MAG TPA: argininosuccinate lyase [Acidimicrobiia bacterium]|nr:argininosuccinate lyase [Acidimicrobiia bacterium]